MNRPRLLAPSAIMRDTPKMTGGGHVRGELVYQARDAIEEGSKSFAFASRLFSKDIRERVWMLYAWCRRCDDLADGQHMGGELTQPSYPGKRLRAIRLLTHRALEGQPTAEPAFDAFGQVASECGITRQMADDVIGGFALDADEWRPRSEMDLMRYCYHVAGAVGVMMAKVMGVPGSDSDTLDRACDLGLAFQLANIARDLSEDDAAGRCYLPMEWLSDQDIEPGQHMKPHHRAELAAMASQLVELMEQHEAAAKLGAVRLAFRSRWAVLSAARIYGAIGRKVRARGQQAWDRRVVISGLTKFGHVLAALVEAVINLPRKPANMPRYSRGDILIEVRMAGPVAPPSMEPLPDEDSWR